MTAMAVPIRQEIPLTKKKVTPSNTNGIMKKYYALLIVSALVISCQKPQNEGVTEDSSFKEVELTIIATNPGTKTYIEKDGAGYTPYWNRGDVLAVSPVSKISSKNSFTNQSNDGEEANFTGSTTINTQGDVLAAFYPKAMTDGRSDNVFKFALAENQIVSSLTSFNRDYDLLVAKTVPVSGENPTSVSMQFRRVLAVLKVILKDNTTSSYVANSLVKQVKLSSSSSILTGRVFVDIVDDTQDISWESSSSYQDVIGTYNAGYEVNGTNAIYLIVNPTTLVSGSTLTVDVITNDTDLTITKEVTLSQDITFRAGNVTPLTINITDDCIAYNLLPTLTLNVTSDLNKSVNGGVFTIENAYAITNCTDQNIIITADGELVDKENVSVSNGTITYSLSPNESGSLRTGWIGLNLEGKEVQKITITQTTIAGVTLNWDFTNDEASGSISSSNSYSYANGSLTVVSSTTEENVLYICPSGKDMAFETKGPSGNKCTYLKSTSGSAAHVKFITSKKGTLSFWLTTNKTDNTEVKAQVNIDGETTEVKINEPFNSNSTAEYLGAGKYSFPIDGTSNPTTVKISKPSSGGIFIYRVEFIEQ